MAIQVGGVTVIDDGRNIINTNSVNVGVVTISGSTGNIQTTGTVTASAIVAPAEIVTFNPANAATAVNPTNKIVLTYSQVVGVGNTGTITIRSGSTSGTILETLYPSGGTPFQITGFQYDPNIGIATVTTSAIHPFAVGDRVTLANLWSSTKSGVSTIFNTTFDIIDVDTTLTFKIFESLQRTEVISIGGGGLTAIARRVSDLTRLSEYAIQLDHKPLPPNTTVYPVMNNNVIISTGGSKGTNVTGGASYSFTTGGNGLSSASPANASTGADPNGNITLTFGSAPVRGTGTIELRRGSTTGTIVESFNAANSSRISISGNDYIIDPTNPLPNLNTSPYEKYYLIMPAGAVVGYNGLNVLGGASYSFNLRAPVVGDFHEGGYIYQQGGGVRRIVAPSCAEVSSSWYSSWAATQRAQQCTGCTGWFVGNISQLQQGYANRQYWDSFSCTCYWSTSQYTGPNSTIQGWSGCFVNFQNGGASYQCKTIIQCLRAFRCVTY